MAKRKVQPKWLLKDAVRVCTKNQKFYQKKINEKLSKPDRIDFDYVFQLQIRRDLNSVMLALAHIAKAVGVLK